ncbi:MAG TPA: hypothetical protein VKQ72_14620 [Aggregatilineales bacterium]|nr:hypothetical protein [Aggregatilineales bacterium]
MGNTSHRVLTVSFAVMFVASSAGISWAIAQTPATPDPALTATAAATATASAAPTLTEYPLPADVEFRFQGQPQQREALIRQSVAAAYNYMRSIGLEDDRGPIAIWVYKDKAQAIRDLQTRYGSDPGARNIISNLQDGHGASHMYGANVIWTGGPGWAAIAGDDWWMQGAAAGYVEVLFQNLAGRLLLSQNGEDPYWMIEGAMMYFSARMMDRTGLFPEYFQASHEKNRWEGRRTTVPLEAIETQYPNRVESVVALGVEYLTSRSGESAFLDYYRGIRRGLSWRDSFKVAFGMTVQQFYDDYRAYRLKNYPVFSNNITGRLVNVQGIMVTDIWLWACPEAPTYDCYPVQAGYVNNAPGAFSVDVPQEKILLAFSTTRHAETIFGYYQRVDSVIPTGVPGSNLTYDYPSQRGTITLDRSKATWLDISSKTPDVNGALSIFVQLPLGLPQ